jgi:hypothetical protein
MAQPTMLDRADKITDEMVRAAGAILMQHGINAPEQVIHTAARAAIKDAFARAIASMQARELTPEAVTRAAKYLAETVSLKAWDGLRANGRAKDNGFEPFRYSNARQEDYRDVVREIGSILGAPSDKSHAALRLALPLLEQERDELLYDGTPHGGDLDSAIKAIRDVIGERSALNDKRGRSKQIIMRARAPNPAREPTFGGDDEPLMALVRALARQAAREDHQASVEKRPDRERETH